MYKKTNGLKNIITVLPTLLLLGIAAGPASALADITINNSRITSSNTVVVTFNDHVQNIVFVDQAKWHIDVNDSGVAPLISIGAEITTPTSPGVITLYFSGSPFSDTSKTYSDALGLYVDANGVRDASSDTNEIVGDAASKAIADGQNPTLTSAKITDANNITVVYSEAVTSVSGDYSSLVLAAGGARSVTGAAGTGTSTIVLTFSGAAAATNDTATMAVGATVVDISPAANALTAVPAQVVTDGQAPTFTAARTALNTIVLTFSENVDVTTTAGEGYAVAGATVTGNTDPAGASAIITLTTTGLTNLSSTPAVTYTQANGTTVDTAANEVADGFNAVASDSAAPIISTVSSSSSNGTYNADQTIAVTVTFSEAVTVIGTPFLTLATGSINRTANYSSGNTTSTLTFSYVVQGGDNSSDLDYNSTNALFLNGSTINDSSNNIANLTLPAPGTAGSLGANKDLVIDTVNLNNVNATTSRLLNISISKVANNSHMFQMNLTAKDDNGNVISGATFNLVSNRTQDTISPTSVTTNATGQAVFNITSTLAGVAQITANGTNRGFTNLTNSSVVFVAGPAFKLAIFGADRVTGLTTINQVVALQDINGNNVTWDNIGMYNITASIVTGSGSITSQNPISVTSANATSVSAFGVNYTATYEKANFTITAPSVGAGAVTFDVTSSITGTSKTVTFYGDIISLNVTTNETSMHANNGNDSVLVTVQLKDVSGNNVQTGGVTIRLSSLTPSLFNNADIAAANVTDANGITTFVVRSGTESGSGLIKGTVIINPAGGTGQSGSSPTITLNQAPYLTNSGVVNSSGTIYAGVNFAITATIKDYNSTGAAIPDYPVTFYIATGDATFANNGLTVYTATTDSGTGNATALITSSNASASNLIGVNVTIVDENGVTKQVGSMQNFTVTPGLPTRYIITPGTSIGLTNVKGTTQRFNITVKDSVGNLNMTADGTINITTDNQVPGNMSNGITTGVLNNLRVSMTNGNASFNYTINSTTAGTAVLTLNSTSLGIANTTVTITTTAATGIALSANKSVQDIVSDVLVLAQLTGPSGDLAISGKDISFVVTNAASLIQLVSTSVTNNSGIAMFYFTRTTAGEYTVTAYNTTLGLSNSTTVTFAGSAANIVVTANNLSPQVNGTVTINATVKDSSGVTSGSLGTGTIRFLANGTEFASASLSTGVASTTYTRAIAGAVTITAFYNATLQNTTTVTFTTVSLPALTVTATPANVTAGTAKNVTFTVTPALSSVFVILSGAGVSVNGTTTDGTITITDVNATSAGNIIATASKTGYTDGTINITAEEAEILTPALVSSITPNSRNAQLGTPVTLFMSVINYGTATATGVSIKQASNLPATVSYQQWNGTSLIGSADTPVDMAAGATANFVLTINATSAFDSSSMTFNVSSTNGANAPISAVNTLTISANATPLADIIMISTTLNVSTPVNNATTFALATINVGGANATGVSLVLRVPSTITGLAYQVNQTNSTTGAIIGPATGLTIAVGATPTFAVFLTPTEAITYDPSNNRITLQLEDGSGKVIGAQSVAVSTL